MARVTVKTLAEAVGVSPSTVSNAYNRPDQLSAELRTAILAKADELGYAGPDAAGRALRRGRTNSVGVVLTERLSYAFSDPYAVGFLTGLAQVLEKARTSITLLPIAQTNGEIDVSAIRQAAVDAVTTLCVPDTHPAFVLARARQLPLVVTHLSDDPTVSYVAIDDVAAGQLVGDHLRALGHRRIGVIVDRNTRAGSDPLALQPDDVTCIDCSARLTGLRRALPDAELVVVSGGHNAEASGRSATGHLLRLADRPTAIVGMSDVLSLGALTALAEAGLSAPGDVSVAGFDDVPAAAAHGLTTVRQPIAEKGRQVGELVLDPDRTDRRIVLPCELVVRSSTGAV
jgi:DNA-binding LacI/PurR family transcriptional regulator